MHDHNDVIIKPVIAEKTYNQAEVLDTYTFIVDPSASKPEISDAIEAIFDGVKVKKVRTMVRKGKTVRNRKSNSMSKRSDTKRAIVTLSEGSIELYGS